MSQNKKKKQESEIREISLSDNSNDLDFIAPLTDVSFEANKLKYGAKSIYQATEQTNLNKEYQQKIKAAEQILQDPVAINEFIISTNARRKELEQQAVENRILFEQKRVFDLAEKRTKEREAAKAHMLATENETHRAMRLKTEEELRVERQQILDKILRQKQKELESIEVFFEQSENSFVVRYENNAIDTLEDSPVARIISSREFGTNKFGAQKYAYRCVICKFSVEESLALSNIHRHIYNYKAKHTQAILTIIEQEYQTKINEKRFEFRRQDNPETRNAKIDNQIAELKKIKGRVVER